MKRLFTVAAVVACTVLTVPVPVRAETYDVRAQPVTSGPAPVQPATLELDTLQPRVVTGDGDNKLVAAGKLTNTGDRKLSDVMVRLQAGSPLTSEDKVNEAVAGEAATDRADSKFTRIGTDLEPGQSAQVRVEVPLSVLQITGPGVYPVLFNVNGTPDFGKQARIASRGFLLPVTGVPGGPALSSPPNAAATTVLWPIVDQPVRVPSSGGTVLTNDDLARSLTTGGRLSELVSAVEQTAPSGSALAGSLCLVIDPDLVQTVTAMADTTNGVYRIRSGNSTVEGSGSTAAQKWLERLKGIARGRCVLALPFADADLVALSKAGLTDLEKLAVDRSKAVAELLQIQTVGDMVWPLGGVIDERTLADLGRRTLLLEPRGVQDGRTVTSPVKLAAAADSSAAGSSVVPIDPVVRNAIGGTAPLSGAASYGPLDLQNGMGALLYRATALGKTGGSLVVAPPRRWKAPVGELTAFLQSMQHLLGGRLVTPRGLNEQVANGGRTVGLTYPVDATGAEISPSITGDLRAMRDRSRDLLSAMSSDGVKGTSPASLIEPLDLGMVRAASGAWRGNNSAGGAASSLVGDQLEYLVSQVRIVQPPGPYYLASSDSPLPLTISNKLPVVIKVRVTFSSTQGLRTSDVNDLTIGANSNLPIRVPTEITRGGQFSVDALLQTINGTPLGRGGEANRITLISTAYGTITLGITVTAGAALVLLVARRLIRRLRSGKQDSAA
ncbi:DUF6049 family protein [Crossiella sp. SN42]|uniref:DUF6049 family protein n=1 Tax=Crossiella sp. SN42 TaxID=2944808 RepID=UPI00207D6458|nr:DUF6049 family protein [Crossiella sp. SN42]MCO1579451.1 DUF6049 family protein [Crossiella sp. SN42]